MLWLVVCTGAERRDCGIEVRGERISPAGSSAQGWRARGRPGRREEVRVLEMVRGEMVQRRMWMRVKRAWGVSRAKPVRAVQMRGRERRGLRDRWEFRAVRGMREGKRMCARAVRGPGGIMRRRGRRDVEDVVRRPVPVGCVRAMTVVLVVVRRRARVRRAFVAQRGRAGVP